MAIGPSSRLTAAIMAGKKRVRPFGPSGVRGWKRSAGDAARMPRLSRYTFAGLACSGFASRQILSAAAEGLHVLRSEEHTSELQSLMRISYAVFCLKKKKYNHQQ